MNDQKTNSALAESSLSAGLNGGLGNVTMRRIAKHSFEDVAGGREPVFSEDNHGYFWHQSGCGCLPPERVMLGHQADMNAKLTDALRALLEICRQWEPDNASGEHRNILAKAQSLLTPNVKLTGGLTAESEKTNE